MISIDKLVQQVQQCKDTSIILPNLNILSKDSVFNLNKILYNIDIEEFGKEKNNISTEIKIL